MDITSQVNNVQSQTNTMSTNNVHIHVQETNGEKLSVDACTYKPIALPLTSAVLFPQACNKQGPLSPTLPVFSPHSKRPNERGTPNSPVLSPHSKSPNDCGTPSPNSCPHLKSPSEQGPSSPTSPAFSPHSKSPNDWGTPSLNSSPHSKSPNDRGPPSPTSPAFSPHSKSPNDRGTPSLNSSPHSKSPNDRGPPSPTSPALSPHSKSPNDRGPPSPTSPAFSPHSKSPNDRGTPSLNSSPHSKSPNDRGPPSPTSPAFSPHSKSPNDRGTPSPNSSPHSKSPNDGGTPSPSSQAFSPHSKSPNDRGTPSPTSPAFSPHSKSPNDRGPPSLNSSPHSKSPNDGGTPSPSSQAFSPHWISPNDQSPPSPTSSAFLPHSKTPNDRGTPSPTSPAFSPHSKSPNDRGPPSPTSPAFSPHSKSPNDRDPPSPTSPAFSPHSKSPNDRGPPSPTSPAFSPHSKSPNDRDPPSPTSPAFSPHLKSPNDRDPPSPTSPAFSPHLKNHSEQGTPSPYSPVFSPHSQCSKHNSRSLSFPQLPISTDVNGQATPLHTKIHEKLNPPKLNKLLSQHQLPTLLMDVFPTSYKYMFKSFEVKASSNVPSFCAVVLISSVRTEEQAIQWIKDLESHTSTTYRITRGNQCKGKRIIYKTDRHCQHMRKKPSMKQKQCGKKRLTLARDKKTDCPTHFTLKLHANQAVQLPCELLINWEHNHSIQSAHALSFRPLSEETMSMFEEYFKQGHSPSSAIHLHGLNLAIKYEGRENELQMIAADRSRTPLPMDVYYLYRKWRVSNLGEECGEKMFDRLDEAVDAYNKEHNEFGGHALLQRYDKGHSENVWEKKANICTEQPLVLAICTPLMSRAHNLLRQSGELVYCDSTASLDRFNCPIFIVSTSSSAGGVPLGIVITSGESEAVLTEAFSLLKKILPEKAFYG